VAPLLNADWTSSEVSIIGVMLYVFIPNSDGQLLSFFSLDICFYNRSYVFFAKSSTIAIQSVLHALFLPTPFKVLSQSNPGANDGKPKGEAKGSLIDSSLTDIPEEVLKPGALYATVL